MKITVKLFASLREGREKEMPKEVSAGIRAKDIAESLHIPADDVAIIMINGRRVAPDAIVEDGDTVALFPPIGGG